MSVIWFIIILSVLVISHEFGHFMMARVNGIKVIEFSVGMGPTLFSFHKSGTKFSLKLLPIGGYCAMDGEDGVNRESEAKGIPYPEANVFSRISVTLAGPVFNFILAFIFSMIIVGSVGIDKPVIQGLTEGRPAIEAGLLPDDEIVSINGEKINIWREISFYTMTHPGETLDITFTRNGEKMSTTITPMLSDDGRYYIGIEGGTYDTDIKGLSIFKGSYYELKFNFVNTFTSLKFLFTGRLSKDDVAGPVGVAQMVDETYDEVKDYGGRAVVLTMMNIAMLLSVNLGVINLLPLPALDGGRLVFLLVELIRGKPVPPEKEGMVHFAGIVLFLILTVFLFYNDIMRWIGA